MTLSALRTRLAAALPLLALLALAGCGSSSSSDDCSKLCTALSACASTLETTVGVLVEDEAVTSATCPSFCRTNTSECADTSGFFSCTSEISCSAIAAVQDEIQSCIAGYCMGPI